MAHAFIHSPVHSRKVAVRRIADAVKSVGFACVLIGLAVRWLWFRKAQTESFFYAHVQDSAVHHELAQRILNDGFPLSGPFEIEPLYACVLAAVYGVVGVDPTVVYLLQIALSAATIGITVHLGRRLFGLPGAIVGGLVAALHPPAIVFDVRLLSVSLGTFLLVGLAAVAHHAWEKGNRRLWFAAGALLGAAVLVRGHVLMVAPFLVLVAFWRGRVRLAVPAVLGLMLSVGPASVHNAVAAGEFVPVSVGGGINLYRGNNGYVSTAPVHPFRLPPTADGLLKKSRLIASIETDVELSAIQADRYWFVRGILHWVDDPKRSMGLLIRKLTQMGGTREYAVQMDIGSIVSSTSALAWIPSSTGLVSAFALLGLLGTRRVRDAGVAAVLVGGSIGVAVFFVVAEYRAPFVPLFGIYAGGGIGLLWRHAHARKRLPFWVGIAVVYLGSAAFLLPPTHQQLPWNGWVGEPKAAAPCAIDRQVRRDARIEARFQLGVFALNHGRLADAEEVMWSVFKEDPGHTAAGVNLSGLLLRKGATEQAASIAEMVLSADACDDKAWSNLATARLRQGAYGKAKRAAVRASEIDPFHPGYWSLLGESELALGQTESARALFERTVRWAPDVWQARARLGRIFLNAGEYEAASTHLQAAVAAQPGREELVGLLGLAEVGRGNHQGARALLSAAVKSGQRGPTLTALARALSAPGAP